MKKSAVAFASLLVMCSMTASALAQGTTPPAPKKHAEKVLKHKGKKALKLQGNVTKGAKKHKAAKKK